MNYENCPIPYFRNELELIAFLKRIKHLDGEGGDGIHVWGPAENAIKGVIAGMSDDRVLKAAFGRPL